MLCPGIEFLSPPHQAKFLTQTVDTRIAVPEIFDINLWLSIAWTWKSRTTISGISALLDGGSREDAPVLGRLLFGAPWRLHIVLHQVDASLVGAQASSIGFRKTWLLWGWGSSLREAYSPLGFKNPAGERYLRLAWGYPRVSLR